jgi:hypothetical protein
MNSKSQFTIISYNICGLANTMRVNELTMFLATHTPSVLILQEPQVDHRTSITKHGITRPRTPTALPRFSGYAAVYFQHTTQPTGIVFYIHSSCTYKALHHIPHCTPYRPAESRTLAAFMWVSSPLLAQPVVIGGIYLHPHAKQVDVMALADHVAMASQPLPGSPPSSTHPPVFYWETSMHDTDHGTPTYRIRPSSAVKDNGYIGDY